MSSRHFVDDVREGAHHAFEKTGATAEIAKVGVLEAIGRVSEIYRALRAFGLDDMLHSAGLQRRRSPALSLGMFGMGVAAGAVLGVMLAPTSGQEARRALMKRATDLLQRTEATAQHGIGAAKEAAHDVVHEAKRGSEWASEDVKRTRANDGPPNGRVRS